MWSLVADNAAEIQWAHRVVAAIQEAEEQGAGAIALDGKMIDKPIVDRAERLLQLAQALGLEGGREWCKMELAAQCRAMSKDMGK